MTLTIQEKIDFLQARIAINRSYSKRTESRENELARMELTLRKYELILEREQPATSTPVPAPYSFFEEVIKCVPKGLYQIDELIKYFRPGTYPGDREFTAYLRAHYVVRRMRVPGTKLLRNFVEIFNRETLPEPDDSPRTHTDS